MATRDTASRTSTRVKPPSRRGGACRKDIGTDLEHFFRCPSRPQDLNLHFPYDRQWRGRDNSLPPIIGWAIRLSGGGLRSQGGRKKFSACFTEGQERSQF